MQRAKSLLANPDMSVTQVGFNLGFSDTSSFTTTFRKHTGLTPTAYRRNLNDGITTSSRVDSNGEISFPLNPHKALAHALVTRISAIPSQRRQRQPSNLAFKRYLYGAGINQPYMEK
jgi:hypothetical protein